MAAISPHPATSSTRPPSRSPPASHCRAPPLTAATTARTARTARRSSSAGPTDRSSWTPRSRDLQHDVDELLAGNPAHPNRKLLKHLANEREHLLTFLTCPGVAATNWRAEQAIRPAVVNRKNWGGNRTHHGAQVQQTLMSVIRSSRQQHVCPIDLLEDLQRHRTPTPSGMLHTPASAVDPRGP